MKENEDTKISKQIKLSKSFEIIKNYNISNYEISKNTGISEAGLSSIKNGDVKNPRETTVNAIYNYLINNFESINSNNFEKKTIPLSNSRLIEKNHVKVVTIIPAKAQLGLQGTMFKEDFIGKLETKVIETEDNWQGRYFDIESTGESMINEDDPSLSIYDGDELRVREIPRDMYINNKLHIHDWREFTFFHYEKGIFTKNVLKHNVEERKVLVHSYNKDKEAFPDEWIDLNDCYIICNVISVTRPRGLKKRLKKLNGTK